MSGTDRLTTSGTGGVLSGQLYDLRGDRGKLFQELLDRLLVLEMRPPGLGTGTEFDLQGLIDLFRFWSAGAWMSALTPRPLGCHGAFLRAASEGSGWAGCE